MIDEFIEDLESHLRLNARGEMSPQLTLDYIKMEVRIYKRRREIEENKMLSTTE